MWILLDLLRGGAAVQPRHRVCLLEIARQVPLSARTRAAVITTTRGRASEGIRFAESIS
jgi:hypothetical protein